MASSKLIIVLSFLVIASFQLHSTVAQTRHVIGGNIGWTIPSANVNYTTLASRETYNVNDILVFNFTTGVHDVAEVTEAAYGPCTTANPISTTTTGPATITLRTAGNHYYICTFGTHCQIGQKVAINVVGATGTPAPTGSTTPPPTGSTTSPPPPPSPSSASSFTAVVPVTFLAAALAFFY